MVCDPSVQASRKNPRFDHARGWRREAPMVTRRTSGLRRSIERAGVGLDRFVTQREAGELTGCSKDTIVRARQAGRFPHARLDGHTWTIPTADLAAAGLYDPGRPPRPETPPAAPEERGRVPRAPSSPGRRPASPRSKTSSPARTPSSPSCASSPPTRCLERWPREPAAHRVDPPTKRPLVRERPRPARHHPPPGGALRHRDRGPGLARAAGHADRIR